MKNVELVIFDMDGLLIDSETVYAKGWKESFKHFGYSVDEDFILKMAGQSTSQNTKDIADLIGGYEKAMEIRNFREEYYFEKVKNGEVIPMPFAVELIEICKKKQLKIAVASSSCQGRVYTTLKANGLFNKFDSITCGSDVDNEKPCPDVYLKTLEKLQVNFSKAIALEDSLTGLKAAINAKIKVALINEKKPMKLDFDNEYFIGYFENLEDFYNEILK